tara:strand:+ start:128 stop:532 length:405 start_codon:yes stop_codon:yes gene_type:complete
MKITKTQLKQIIKEELSTVLSERSAGTDEIWEAEREFEEFMDTAFNSALSQQPGEVWSVPEEVHKEIPDLGERLAALVKHYGNNLDRNEGAEEMVAIYNRFVGFSKHPDMGEDAKQALLTYIKNYLIPAKTAAL